MELKCLQDNIDFVVYLFYFVIRCIHILSLHIASENTAL